MSDNLSKKIVSISRKLENHSKNYYKGDSKISDEEYDNLKKLLKNLNPNHPFLKKVGGSVKKGFELPHIHPMLSILDVKNSEDAYKWINNLYEKFSKETPLEERTVFVEYKVDGVSGSIHYDKKGNFLYAVTRGDGYIGNKIVFGKLISENAAFPIMFSEPDVIGNERFEVRGEFVIPLEYKDLDLFKDKSLRNMCSGALNRQEFSEVLNYIKFVPYQIWNSKGLLSYDEEEEAEASLKRYYEIPEINHNKLQIYENLNTNRSLINISEIESYYLNYLENRNKIPFETDGLVLTFPNNKLFKKIDSAYVITTDHRYNLALKPPTKKAITVLKDIEWTVSRTGRMIPNGIIIPVKIGNVNISCLTLNNAKFVKENEISKNSVIEIERANDVIPHFLRITEKSEDPVVLPTNCPECGTKLKESGVDLVCTNEKCEGKIINTIVYWLKDVHNIDGIAEKTVEKICKLAKPKIYDIVDFYEFILLDKFDNIINGEVAQDNIYNAIKDSLGNITELSLIEGLGIPGIRKNKLMKMGIYNIKNLKNFKANRTRSVDEETVINWISNKSNLQKLDKYHKYFNKYLKDRVVDRNWKICVTGKFENMTRNQIIKKIEKYGCTYVDHVTSSTKYLLNDDNELTSTKVEAATKYEIPIITSKEFFDILEKN